VPRASRGSRGSSRRLADELRGNVVKAFIVLADGYEPSEALADEIKGHVRERLSAYAYPRRVEFVSELPKTLTGQIRRIELRQLELDRDGPGADSGD
jgi:acetyl-CoA synthetase